MADDALESEGGGGLPPFVQDPLGVLRRRWRWMLAALLLGLGATGAYVGLLMQPRYEATATVLVASQRVAESFVRPGVSADPFEKINAMVGEVLSTDNLVRLIEEHDLYPELRRRERMAAVVGRMREDVRVEAEQGVGSYYDKARTFEIAYGAPDPDLAAAVANGIAASFQTASTRIRTEQARMALEFLNRALDEADRELREQNREITEFHERYRGELPADLDPNLARIERMQQQRQSLGLQIAETETRLAMLASTEDKGSPEARVNELRARVRAEAAVNTEDHPNLRSLRRQLESAEADLAVQRAAGGLQSRNAIGGAAMRTVDELRRQDIELGAEIAELEARVARIPARAEVLTAMEEKAKVLRETYIDFLRKVHDAELSLDLETQQTDERVSVLNPAQPPAHPERSRATLLLLGVVASFGMALGIGVLFEMLDPVLLTSEQVEGAGNLPVLGSVAQIG
jgi:uncharacterized protein involved in exopolysaccharide biosynthesis